MASARDIQSRIKSVQDTMKITNAMYLISSTKVKKARRALTYGGKESVKENRQGCLSRFIRAQTNPLRRLSAPLAPNKKDAIWRLFYLVGMTGFEPATSASRTQRSTKLSHIPLEKPSLLS